jgi:hypothetical protein
MIDICARPGLSLDVILATGIVARHGDGWVAFTERNALGMRSS